jgi:hypothetical protein
MLSQGFHDDVPEADYHADRESLSVSGAKVILRSPAEFAWGREHPTTSDAFDLGSAAHRLVLGAGPVIHVVDAETWQTKAAREERDKAREAGEIPLLVKDNQRVLDMADALSGHALAMSLFEQGRPEVSAYAVDESTGVMRRCRFDWLSDDLGVDYKTSVSADPRDFGRAAASFGYHSQHAWYLDLARDLGVDLRGFLFVVQAKSAPYLVSVVELTPDAVDVGRARNRSALERYRDCMESGLWPGYPQQVTPVDIPRWAYYDQEIPA